MGASHATLKAARRCFRNPPKASRGRSILQKEKQRCTGVSPMLG